MLIQKREISQSALDRSVIVCVHKSTITYNSHTCRPLRDVHVPLPSYFQITCKTLIDFFLNLIFRIRQSRMAATRCVCTGSYFKMTCKMNLKFCYKCNVPACVGNPSKLDNPHTCQPQPYTYNPSCYNYLLIQNNSFSLNAQVCSVTGWVRPLTLDTTALIREYVFRTSCEFEL